MTDVSEDPRRTSLQVDTPSSFFGQQFVMFVDSLKESFIDQY